MTNPMMNRRALIKAAGSASLFAGGGILLSACSPDGGTEPTTEPTADNGPEAPMLADLVEAGELPKVEERLPTEPLTVEPVDRVGSYGGSWTTALLGPADTQWLSRTMAYENLVRWVPNWTGAPGNDEIIANIAASFEFDDTGTEYTFTLRAGMKWSDGTPFTTDDIGFAFNDVMLNTALYPFPPTGYATNGVSGTLEIADEHTFTFRFEHPNSLFLPILATGGGGLITAHPRHYLETFHKEYNADVDTVTADEGYDTWTDLFLSKAAPFDNPELPVHYAWTMTTALADGARAVAERNPFYFKVDTEGSQLPYLDKVIYEVLQDDQVMLTKALNGELDMHVRHFNSPTNKPVLAESRKLGGYDFFDTVTAEMNTLVLMLNLNHPDSDKNELFNNRDFRIGLSHAINRQEVIDVAFQRQGEPFQAAPRPESPFYDEQFAKQYTEYDVDLANEHLDRAGYTERGSGDIRIGPSGKPISFTVDFTTDGVFPGWPESLELIKDYYKEVGVDIRLNPIDRSLFEERRAANQHDAVVWAGGGGIDVILNPYWYAPLSTRSDYGMLWAAWYGSRGAEGVEPPANTKRQMELYDELRAVTAADEQEALMNEILAIARAEFYCIGLGLPSPGYGIVKDTFRNVPESMPGAFTYPTPAPTNPEQYFKS